MATELSWRGWEPVGLGDCGRGPIALLFFLIGVRRVPAWKAATAALAAAVLVARLLFGTPATILAASFLDGAAFGLFPICWIVLPAIFLHGITVESGHFEVIKDSIARLTRDSRVQVLLIAFAFGAFVEAAAGFGARWPSPAMLAGLGIGRFRAAGLCLLANTAPVPFGSIGIPVVTLASVTQLPLYPLSAAVGRIGPILSLVVPCYLVVAFVGWRKTWAVMPAIVAVSVAFAGVQFLVATFAGPFLVGVLSSLAALLSLLVLLRFWQPRDAEESARGGPGDGSFPIASPPFAERGRRICCW